MESGITIAAVPTPANGDGLTWKSSQRMEFNEIQSYARFKISTGLEMLMAAVCSKCGSTELIPDACVMDRTEMGATRLSATVMANPGAWLMKEPVTSPFRAVICGSCGFTEFYVQDPKALLEAARQAATAR